MAALVVLEGAGDGFVGWGAAGGDGGVGDAGAGEDALGGAVFFDAHALWELVGFDHGVGA